MPGKGCRKKEESMLVEWNNEAKAYLAGIIDGEGCIAFRANHKVKSGDKIYHEDDIRVTLVLTSEYLLQKIARIVPYGTGNVALNKRRLPDRHKQSYRLVWTASSACNLLDDILPWLILKRGHAKILLDYYALKKSVQHLRSGPGNAYPENIKIKGKDVEMKSRLLNKRGV